MTSIELIQAHGCLSTHVSNSPVALPTLALQPVKNLLGAVLNPFILSSPGVVARRRKRNDKSYSRALGFDSSYAHAVGREGRHQSRCTRRDRTYRGRISYLDSEASCSWRVASRRQWPRPRPSRRPPLLPCSFDDEKEGVRERERAWVAAVVVPKKSIFVFFFFCWRFSRANEGIDNVPMSSSRSPSTEWSSSACESRLFDFQYTICSGTQLSPLSRWREKNQRGAIHRNRNEDKRDSRKGQQNFHSWTIKYFYLTFQLPLPYSFCLLLHFAQFEVWLNYPPPVNPINHESEQSSVIWTPFQSSVLKRNLKRINSRTQLAGRQRNRGGRLGQSGAVREQPRLARRKYVLLLPDCRLFWLHQEDEASIFENVDRALIGHGKEPNVFCKVALS